MRCENPIKPFVLFWEWFMMERLIFLTLILSVLTQKYSELLDDNDFKNSEYMNSKFNPNTGVFRQSDPSYQDRLVPEPSPHGQSDLLSGMYQRQPLPDTMEKPSNLFDSYKSQMPIARSSFGSFPGPGPIGGLSKGSFPGQWPIGGGSIGQLRYSGNMDAPRQRNKKDFEYDYNEIYDMGARVEQNNKWGEFKKMVGPMRQEADDPDKRIQNYNTLKNWAKKLPRRQPGIKMSLPEPKRMKPNPFAKPSPGMNPYWAENQNKPQPSKTQSAAPVKVPTEVVMRLALKKLAEFDKLDKQPQSGTPNKTENTSKRPMVSPNASTNLRPLVDDFGSPIRWVSLHTDDFGSPIRWVSLHTNETSEGLAKVTDPRSGLNRQYVINGTIFVPVIDYNLERLGLVTKPTTMEPAVASVSTALRTITRNVDLQGISESDWLVFEVALGGRAHDEQCDSDGCQARCNQQACETMCTGDTCAAGCVGRACNSFCKGPGCLSMCIGESCNSRCEGLSCEARCRGKGCEARCRTFSCRHVINGDHKQGGGAWTDHYPQYDEANVMSNY